jgi:SNF2 family DNA or RNA helicase
VWGASATIVANTADDVYNQLKAVNHPIGNMDFNKFKSRFTHPKNQELRLERADELRQSLIDHGVYIQRSKKQVEPNLPELNTTQNNVPVTNGQIKTLAQEKSGSSPPNIMHERMAVADLKTDQSVAKAAGILQTGKKVAIFTGFRSSRQLLVNKLQSVLERLKMNKTVFTIDGDQNSEEREIVVSSFKDPDSPVMAIVINLQAGGTGVDFPNILTDVIINDFDWAPSTDTQSINRFFRISSKQDVNVSYMVANGTVDEEIFKRLQLKKQIADAIAILNDEESRLISEKRGSMDAQLRQTRENRRKLMIALANEEATDKDTFKI